MKGQHLAIETMVTFVMGISLAIGVITVFNQYREDVLDTTKDEETVIAASKLENAIFQLKNADSGSKTVNLPEDLGTTDYTVALNEGIVILTPRDNYTKKIGTPGNLRGSTDGGKVTLYKNQNNYVLRE